MLPIGSALPHDARSLQSSLATGLAPSGLAADAVTIDGEFPQLASIKVNLTGARFHRELEFASPDAAAVREQLCFSREVELKGNPVHFEKLPMQLHLQAQDVVLAAAKARSGEGKVLTLDRAGSGTIEITATRADLQNAMFEAGREAASGRGADVQSVDLHLQNEGPRTLQVRSVIVAKAMFFTTTLTVSGRIEVDDQLNARLRDLQCEGDGMIGKMAAGALQSQFQKVQERPIPLGGAVAGLRLRDVQLQGGEELRINATFGSDS